MIQVGSDKGPPKLLKRSIRHLIPIKVTRDDTEEEVEAPSRSDSSEMTVEVTTRSCRCAAIYGKALRKNW